MTFPIVLRTSGAEPPDASIYYEVAADGRVYQIRDFPTYRACTRVSGPVPGLLPQRESLQLRFPPLPRGLIGEVLDFFIEAFRRYGGEAIVLLFYDPRRQRFEVGVPPQTIPVEQDWGRRPRVLHLLRYESLPRPPGFLRFGSIHSHADQAAYASGTDWEDERFEDGLHIIFGDLHRSLPSTTAAFVANGVRFRVQPSQAIEAGSPSGRPARPEWLARIRTVEHDSSWQHGWTDPIEPRPAPGYVPASERRGASNGEDSGA